MNIIDERIQEFMLDTLGYELRVQTQRTDIRAKIREYAQDIPNWVECCVGWHYLYDPYFNHIYLEYDLDRKIRLFMDADTTRKMINEKIKRDFKGYTGCKVEVIQRRNIPESVNHDMMPLVTPWTIGYWKSMFGGYRFLENKSLTLLKANIQLYPEVDFSEETVIIPTTFKDYINEVTELNHEYQNMNDSGYYNQRKYFDTKVPELFNKYNQIFQRYFNFDLTSLNIIGNDYLYYAELKNLWKYLTTRYIEDDNPRFDFGDEDLPYWDNEQIIEDGNWEYGDPEWSDPTVYGPPESATYPNAAEDLDLKFNSNF